MTENKIDKKKENIKQRAYLNSLTSLIDFGAKLISGFIVSPFIVNGLGSTAFGMWETIRQMAGYAQLTDAKATTVLKWTIANKREVAEQDELRNDLTTAFLVTAFILPIVLIIGGILTWFSPTIINAPPEYHTIIRITCSFMVLSVIITKVFDLFEAILKGMNMIYKRMGFRALIILIGGGLQILTLYFGLGLIGLAVVQIFVVLATGFALYFAVKKNVGWYGFGKTNFKSIISFSKISGWFIAWTGIKTLLYNSDKIILGYLVGPATVSVYAITRFTTQSIEGLISSVVLGIIPGAGSMFGKKEFDKLIKTRAYINTLTWLLGISLGASLLLINKSFIGLWIRDNQFAGLLANFLIVVILIQYLFIVNDSELINLTLKIQNKVYFAFTSVIITILLALILVPKYEIIGLCLSIIAGRLVMTVSYPIIIKKSINDHSRNNYIDLAKKIVISVILLILPVLISQYFLISNWIYLILIFPIAFIINVSICWFFGVGKDFRNDMFNIFKKIKFTKSD
ncbi:MAG: oligosaccharide flippase family protein [Bacteroidales bacterium]|nr:oligosaccharide flippase family protein [Bacteroidales bacterium]